MPRGPRTSPPAGLRVLDDPRALAAALSPLRRRLLAELGRAPDSATGLARRLGLPRQRLNYHLRALEDSGLVELFEERQRRGCVERSLRVTARAFVIDPAVLGSHPADPEAIQDRFSSSYQIAAAARLLRELTQLQRGAERAKKPLATLTLETEVRFASAARRAAFAEELGAAVAALAARYQDDAPASRAYRLVLAAHPKPKPTPPETHEGDAP
ncbi:MAG TPA: helix-turn-helix domain-containing protein [Planctomycetota bacterium]